MGKREERRANIGEKLVELCRELQTALGNAKWQKEKSGTPKEKGSKPLKQKMNKRLHNSCNNIHIHRRSAMYCATAATLADLDVGGLIKCGCRDNYCKQQGTYLHHKEIKAAQDIKMNWLQRMMNSL